ncbi:hypothetical protein [Lapillicoccus jejuensis]|uniref:Uncharacterized protein n=1 Tax=Lapillicoccus jejuensis TaxID=402171 RepID=A0A542DXM7_9MICO|nr:hypothetical protein [Lapillicoccus jejuensis]TQJ07840.1 hypothetical protein FB458_0910 [Lapillicoccus jejuensis]
MGIDRSHRWWTGTEAADLGEYLTAYTAAGYPATRVVHARCARCTGATFRLRVDDEEGCAERTCTACGDVRLMLDSGDVIEEADLGEAECPCGGAVFEVAVGFAFTAEQDVRWVYVALRCTADGVLGVYADWKIDDSPGDHLLTEV